MVPHCLYFVIVIVHYNMKYAIPKEAKVTKPPGISLIIEKLMIHLWDVVFIKNVCQLKTKR